jgi:uncharacterized membrane protein HdeD (DUF308 family)
MNPQHPPSPDDTVQRWTRLAASPRWRWRAAEGAGLALLGAVCLIGAPEASPALSGGVLLAVGAIRLGGAWRTEQPGLSFGLCMAGALLAFAAGLRLLEDMPPAMLGLVFAAYFAGRGLTATLLAARYRRQRLNQWEWFAVSGVASLILAMLILSGLPGPYVWMLGLMLGVELIFDAGAVLAQVRTSDRLSETAPARAARDMPAAALQGGAVYEDRLGA